MGDGVRNHSLTHESCKGESKTTAMLPSWLGNPILALVLKPKGSKQSHDKRSISRDHSKRNLGKSHYRRTIFPRWGPVSDEITGEEPRVESAPRVQASSNARNKAMIQDGKVVVQDVRGRKQLRLIKEDILIKEDQFRKPMQEEMVKLGNVGSQNRET
ncbi:hypothetical protein Tco_0006823 [Tanacetum coccineum]